MTHRDTRVGVFGPNAYAGAARAVPLAAAQAMGRANPGFDPARLVR